MANTRAHIDQKANGEFDVTVIGRTNGQEAPILDVTSRREPDGSYRVLVWRRGGLMGVVQTVIVRDEPHYRGNR